MDSLPDSPVQVIVANTPTPDSPPAQTPTISPSFSSNPSPKVSTSPSLWPLIFIPVIALIFLLVAAIPVYSNLNLGLSPTLTNSLSQFFYQIPLTPKTPKQILLSASSTSKALTSYNPDFSVSASLGSGEITLGSLDLKISGPIDFTEPTKPKFDLALDSSVNATGTKYQASGKIRSLDKKIYAKIDSLSDSLIETFLTYSSFSTYSPYSQTTTTPAITDELRGNLNQFFTNWLSYDTSGLNSAARQALDSQSQQQSMIDSSRRRIQDFLSRPSVVPEVKLIGIETIDNTKTYHLKLVPSQKAKREIVSEFFPEKDRNSTSSQQAIDSISSNIDSVTIEAWFATSDSLIRKFSFQTQINVGSIYSGLLANNSYSNMGALSMAGLSNLSTTRLSFSSVLNLRDVGKTVTIQIPSPQLPSTQYLTNLQAATKTPSQLAAEAKQAATQNIFTNAQSELLKTYVDTNRYPATFTTPTGFVYKQKSAGKGYVLYDKTQEPYYGISNSYPYPHKLTQTDLD